MSIEDLLIHTVDVARPTHAKVGGQKQTGSVAVASGVRCRIAPSAEAFIETALGRGQVESHRGWFARDADVKRGDLLTWLDRSPALELEVLTVHPAQGGEPEANHLAVTLSRRV